MSEETDGEDDVTLVRRVAQERDEQSLAKLMKRWSLKVTRYLASQFDHQLDRDEIDQAVNDAAQNLWRSARTFNPEKGKFGTWFLTIAHRAALDIIDSEKKHVAAGMDFDPKDPVSDECDEDSESLSVDEWRADQMDDIIENVLIGFEQILARADMAVGGSADSARLAEKHNKTKNTVQSTRSKVRKKIRNLILEREATRSTTKGTK
jgi:DNA-directed RNA polymerase specialized sigma24 family protein